MEPYNEKQRGFWSWIKKNANIIAAVCVVVGLPALGAAVKLAASLDVGADTPLGPEAQRSINNYEPTASEAAILDPWVANRLVPFYTKLLNEAKAAFASSDPTYQLNMVNNISMKICVIRNYYKNHDTKGLSSSAVNLRNELIDMIFTPIEEMIANSFVNTSNLSILKYPISTQDGSDFIPLDIKLFSTNCEKYVISNPNQLQPSPEPLLTNTPIVVNPITNEIIPEKEIKKSESNSGIALTILVLLGLAIMLFKKDEEVEKKKSKNVESTQ